VGIVRYSPRIGCECTNNGLSPITRLGSENFTHIVTSGLGDRTGTDARRGHPGAIFADELRGEDVGRDRIGTAISDYRLFAGFR